MENTPMCKCCKSSRSSFSIFTTTTTSKDPSRSLLLAVKHNDAQVHKKHKHKSFYKGESRQTLKDNWKQELQESTKQNQIDDHIELALLQPENESVFLTASIEFLQRRLLQKIRSQSETRIQDQNGNQKHKCDKSHCFFAHRASSVTVSSSGTQKTYSDLLIVTTTSSTSNSNGNNNSCDTRTIYVKLKDVERFDEALKSESSYPKKKLSLEKILPRPGHPSKRYILRNIFKKLSGKRSKNDNEDNVETLWSHHLMPLQTSTIRSSNTLMPQTLDSCCSSCTRMSAELNVNKWSNKLKLSASTRILVPSQTISYNGCFLRHPDGSAPNITVRNSSADFKKDQEKMISLIKSLKMDKETPSKLEELIQLAASNMDFSTKKFQSQAKVSRNSKAEEYACVMDGLVNGVTSNSVFCYPWKINNQQEDIKVDTTLNSADRWPHMTASKLELVLRYLKSMPAQMVPKPIDIHCDCSSNCHLRNDHKSRQNVNFMLGDNHSNTSSSIGKPKSTEYFCHLNNNYNKNNQSLYVNTTSSPFVCCTRKKQLHRSSEISIPINVAQIPHKNAADDHRHSVCSISSASTMAASSSSMASSTSLLVRNILQQLNGCEQKNILKPSSASSCKDIAQDVGNFKAEEDKIEMRHSMKRFDCYHDESFYNVNKAEVCAKCRICHVHNVEICHENSNKKRKSAKKKYMSKASRTEQCEMKDSSCSEDCIQNQQDRIQNSPLLAKQPLSKLSVCVEEDENDCDNEESNLNADINVGADVEEVKQMQKEKKAIRILSDNQLKTDNSNYVLIEKDNDSKVYWGKNSVNKTDMCVSIDNNNIATQRKSPNGKCRRDKNKCKSVGSKGRCIVMNKNNPQDTDTRGDAKHSNMDQTKNSNCIDKNNMYVLKKMKEEDSDKNTGNKEMHKMERALDVVLDVAPEQKRQIVKHDAKEGRDRMHKTCSLERENNLTETGYRVANYSDDQDIQQSGERKLNAQELRDLIRRLLIQEMNKQNSV